MYKNNFVKIIQNLYSSSNGILFRWYCSPMTCLHTWAFLSQTEGRSWKFVNDEEFHFQERVARHIPNQEVRGWDRRCLRMAHICARTMAKPARLSRWPACKLSVYSLLKNLVFFFSRRRFNFSRQWRLCDGISTYTIRCKWYVSTCQADHTWIVSSPGIVWLVDACSSRILHIFFFPTIQHARTSLTQVFYIFACALNLLTFSPCIFR